MIRRSRALLHHPVVRTLLFERFLITGSATLALAALAMGRVKPSEIRGLMDARLLTLFFVLTVAVELGKVSGLFDRLVVAVIRRARTCRGLIREGGRPGFFWKPFCAVSGVLLILLLLIAVALLTLER